MTALAGIWPQDFLTPSRLYGLLVVVGLAIVYLGLALQRRSYTVRFTNLELLDLVAPKRPGWRRHVTALAFLAAAASLIVAWARPADEVLVAKERATIVLAVDTSLSMDADDVAPSRIVAAKAAAAEFVRNLPPQINIGLVSFNGVAQIRVTPSTDHEAVLRAIDGLRLGEATAIGEAIFASLQALEAVAPPADPSAPDGGEASEPIPARIVVMTDGKTTAGRPDTDGAAAAVEAGVPVWTIAFGTENGTIFYDGERTAVPVETSTLEDIATRTGGRFFAAASQAELEDVYRDIGSSVAYEREVAEVTHRWVGYAVVLLLASAALSLAFLQRIP